MATRNRTLTLIDSELEVLARNLLALDDESKLSQIENKIIHQDMLTACKFLPSQFVDLMFFDPPYNMTKSFNGTKFKKTTHIDYANLLDDWIQATLHTLKPNATIYICGDWSNSAIVYEIASRYFQINNRITWEREKGRGALRNWKNNSEDIWFCSLSNDYYFNPDAVKLKRKVLAPYRHKNGEAKDWEESDSGNFRLTAPSNLWTDITVPFWSMPENTNHPTQKPEKLLAKLILASSQEGDFIFDPFLGSGTTTTVAKKLNRKYLGIEKEKEYACTALKRLDLSNKCATIQGYTDGVFWERNSGPMQSATKNKQTYPLWEL